MSFSWSDLFGDSLVGQNDTSLNTNEHLQDKYVMIYFSAHWCPPCRGFTPKLAEFYNNFKQTNRYPFEVIFVSSDQDESQWKEYFASMPWVALPYSDRDRKAALSSKYKISGIPSLLVLSPQGELITEKGRAKVMQDEKGQNFPWIPRTITQILEDSVIIRNSDKVDQSEWKGKYLGIYFSAHWCGPCRNFTPTLIETYKTIKDQGKNFEIIFVSGDRSERDFQSYYKDMPWLALEFGDEHSDELNDACNVEGIPQLTLINEQGELVTHNGRAYVSEDLEGKEFPWEIKALQKLSFCGDEINSEMCVVGLFNDDQQGSESVEMLRPIAEQHKAAHQRGERDQIHFFYAVGDDGLGDRICSLFNLSRPIVTLLNFPKSYYTCEPTAEAVQAMLDGVHNQTIEMKPLPDRR